MNKKAQAGMEYLMTYGWAIVLVVTVVGILTLVIGQPSAEPVFSSSNPTKLMIKGTAVEGSVAIIKLQNITGGEIKIQNITATVGYENCDNSNTSNIVGAGGELKIECDVPPDITQGQVAIQYMDAAGLIQNLLVSGGGTTPMAAPPSGEDTDYLCSDGYSNDSDALIDCEDPDCDTLIGCDPNHPQNPCPLPVVKYCEFDEELTCNDSFDNDRDDGLQNGGTDCGDLDCAGDIGGQAGELCEFETETLCADGFDNDADGLPDEQDTDCMGTFCGGDGTGGNPYLICNCTALQAMNDERNANYALNQDIDCTGFDSGDGKGFNPVGKDSYNKFYGNFDGQNHTITGLTINRPSENYVGMFGFVEDPGSITSVGLVGANVTGREWVGGIAGRSDVSVQNSFVTGSITSPYNYSYVGGLVGEAYGNITNTYTNATVTGNYGTGGLIGRHGAGTNVTNSYSAGTVSGSNRVGGLIGWNGNGGGSINNSFTVATVNASSSVGGLTAQGKLVSNSFWQDHAGDSASFCFIFDCQAIYEETECTLIAGCTWDEDFGPFEGMCEGEFPSDDGCTSVASESQFYSNSNEPLANWNFSTVWKETGGLPQLKWQ